LHGEDRTHDLAELRRRIAELSCELERLGQDVAEDLTITHRLTAIEFAVRHQESMLSGRIALAEERLAEQIESAIQRILAGITPAHPATGIRLTYKGEPVADLTLDVDVQGEKIVGQFTDDKGDVTDRGPAGPDGVAGTIAYMSSDPAIVTVDATTGALTFNKAGQVVLTAEARDDLGNTIANFPTAVVNLSITPGVATGLSVSVQGAEPVPVPPPVEPPVDPPIPEPIPEPTPEPTPAPPVPEPTPEPTPPPVPEPTPTPAPEPPVEPPVETPPVDEPPAEPPVDTPPAGGTVGGF
jgi:hypothetical protein